MRCEWVREMKREERRVDETGKRTGNTTMVTHNMVRNECEEGEGLPSGGENFLLTLREGRSHTHTHTV